MGLLRKGMVLNIEATIKALRNAIESAEMMSGREVHSCWISIGGSHINSIISRGVVAVGKNKKRETREIEQDDIDRVLEAARAVAIPMDRWVLEVIPQSYNVDDQKGIRDPLDMIGVRLEAEVHIITCSGTGAQNLVKCVDRANFHVNDLVLKSLAAGRAVLLPEEKELGTLLIDLGGGTTDVLVYARGAPYTTLTIPVGGGQVSWDISQVKQISFESAEKIKIDAGCCWEPYIEGEDITIPGLGNRESQMISRQELFSIIRPRMEETFAMVKANIGKQELGGGIVLTGGGSQLLGAAELASKIFGLKTRIGNPLPVGGLVSEYRNPAYATAVGLALVGNDRENASSPGQIGEIVREKRRGGSIFGKITDWFREEFF